MALKKGAFHTAKNTSGDPTLLCVNDDGELLVSSDSPGTCKHDRGTATTTDAVTFEDTATITGALTKVYDNFEFSGSSTVEVLWKICYIDDAGGTPVETILADFITGPGQYTVCCNLDCPAVDTTGGTGTQEFKLKGRSIDASCLGDIFGYLAVKER